MENISKLRTVRDVPFPTGVVKVLEKKGNPKYVTGHTIIDILNVIFGDNWSVEYSQPWVESFGERITVTVKARLTATYLDETGKEVTVTREGFGSDCLKKGGEENLTKSASTDAFKKAAYSFGIINQFLRSPEEYQYYNSLISGQTEWTQGAYNAFGEEWKTISMICRENGLNQQDLLGLVYKLSNGTESSIRPSNIVTVVEALKSMYSVEKPPVAVQPELIAQTSGSTSKRTKKSVGSEDK